MAQAVESEVEDVIAQHADLKTAESRQRVLRRVYLPEQAVMTEIGPALSVSRVRD